MVVYAVRGDEEDRAIAGFIRRSGGIATQQQIDEWLDAREAPARRRAEEAHVAAQKALQAAEMERDDPRGAITVYREVIKHHRRAAQQTRDRWRWRDFPYLYNRLTMLLERTGAHADALAEIAAYEMLPCADEGTKSDRRAISKRKSRLETRRQAASAK
jgi:hypothetical protein